MGVLRPDLMMKCIIPVVMAGIIAVRALPPRPCSPCRGWAGLVGERVGWAGAGMQDPHFDARVPSDAPMSQGRERDRKSVV